MTSDTNWSCLWKSVCRMEPELSITKMTSEARLRHSEINNQSINHLTSQEGLSHPEVCAQGGNLVKELGMAKCTDLPDEGACCV